MSVIADLIRAGVDPELVAKVVDEMVASARGATQTRSAHAEAQARYRAKMKSQMITNDQNDQNDQNDHGDAADKEIPHTPKEINPSGLEKEISKEKAPLKGGQKKGSCLPEDWQPSESLFAYGTALSLNRQQTADHLEDMRLWAHSNRNRGIARKDDWNKTAMAWLRREAKKPQARAGPMRKQGATYGEMLAKLKGYITDDESGFNFNGTELNPDSARPSGGPGFVPLAIGGSRDPGGGRN